MSSGEWPSLMSTCDWRIKSSHTHPVNALSQSLQDGHVDSGSCGLQALLLLRTYASYPIPCLFPKTGQIPNPPSLSMPPMLSVFLASMGRNHSNSVTVVE